MIRLDNTRLLKVDFDSQPVLPVWLLQECLDSYGIKYSPHHLSNTTRLYQALHTFPVNTFDKTSPDYRILARFINPGCNWTLSTLTTALQHQEQTILSLHAKFHPGLPTPDNPHRVSGRILYGHLITNKIPICISDTIEDMYQKWIIHNMTRSDWIEVMPFLFESIDFNTKIQLFQPIFTARTDQKDLVHHGSYIHHLNPTTCIIESIKNLKINLLSCSNPFYEYIMLMQLGTEYWRPKDSELCRQWIRNPFLFYTDETFQINIPPHLYPIEDLKHLCRFDTVLDGQYYETAFTQCFDKTFYYGWRPNIINDRTFITLDDVEHIPTYQLILYGCPESGYYAYTLHELTEMFVQNEDFNDPRTNQIFPYFAIQRLLRIVQARWNSIYNSGKEERLRLASVIQKTIQLTRECSLSEKIWIQYFKNNISSETENLDRLCRFGMALRGWLDGNYPIDHAPVFDQDQVDIHVTQCLNNLEATINDKMLDLPIYIYRREFQRSHRQEDGYTLRDRISIIKRGEDAGMESCIRLSSNWILSSYVKYCQLVNIKPCFAIETLKFTS